MSILLPLPHLSLIPFTVTVLFVWFVQLQQSKEERSMAQTCNVATGHKCQYNKENPNILALVNHKYYQHCWSLLYLSNLNNAKRELKLNS